MIASELTPNQVPKRVHIFNMDNIIAWIGSHPAGGQSTKTNISYIFIFKPRYTAKYVMCENNSMGHSLPFNPHLQQKQVHNA